MSKHSNTGNEWGDLLPTWDLELPEWEEPETWDLSLPEWDF